MSEEVLNLSLRPKTLSSFFGQDTVINGIRKQMTGKRPPRTWLLHGEPGTGKTSIMRILAIAAQCSHMKLWGDPCPTCWAQEDSYCIHEINAGNATGIDEIRNVVQLSMFKPTTGLKRVIILDEVHRVSKQAMDLLLKPTEEPPPTTMWVLGTSEFSGINAAMKRRCTIYQMKSLSISGVEDFLKKQAHKAGIVRPLEPLFEECHQHQVGSPGVLLGALEKYAAGASALDALMGGEAAGVDTFRICKAVTSGRWSEVVGQLKDAPPDSARYIRSSVAGWILGCLKKESSSSGQERAAVSLLELSNLPLVEASMMHWLWATLWKVTKRYRA